MKPKIYLETTIPSYLTAWPSRDPVRPMQQRITQEWWESGRAAFDSYISRFVLQEVARGDRVAAARRLDVLEGILVLEADVRAEALASELLRGVPLASRAAVDALQIAIAVVGGMDFLLSWNCTHIANLSLRGAIDSVCRSQGYSTTFICTPEDLLKGSDHGQ